MTQTLDLLEKLIAFPTVSAESNLPMIAYLRDYLTERGFELHQIDDAIGQKAGLFACLGPRGPGGILLSGHTDVVPTEGQTWNRPDFELSLDTDRVYGRGTTDMKGFLASMLHAADLASKQPIKRALKLVFSFDEEIGCVGIQQMIGRLESTIGLPDIAIVGEPTSMQVAIGHKGKAAIQARCIGQSGHSALAPNFLNAIHLATDFVLALRAVQSDIATNGARDYAYDIPYSTLHVGKIQSGLALNIVPDTALIDFEYRHLAADKSEDIMGRINAAAEQVVVAHRSQFAGAAIGLNRYNAYPGLDISADSDVISQVQHFAQSNAITKVAFGTEAGYFDALGIATVVCGPGNMAEQGHKPDEYLMLDQLSACDAMMRRIVDSLRE